jgi:hypothetical protein
MGEGIPNQTLVEYGRVAPASFAFGQLSLVHQSLDLW